MATSFSRPPLHEVVLAVHFEAGIAMLRSEYIGMFWSAVQDQFPEARQQPLLGAVASPIVPGEQFPMPRYWFTSRTGEELLQVQRTAFIFNWRKRENAYPHFHQAIKPSFDRWFGRFEQFLRESVGADSPQITRCELNYVNVVPQGECGWNGPADTPRILPAVSLPRPAGAGALSGLQCQYGYGEPSSIELGLSVRTGSTSAPPEVPVLIFEIKALGIMNGVRKSETDAWFNDAHDAVVECFSKVTNREVQEAHWGRVESPA